MKKMFSRNQTAAVLFNVVYKRIIYCHVQRFKRCTCTCNFNHNYKARMNLFTCVYQNFIRYLPLFKAYITVYIFSKISLKCTVVTSPPPPANPLAPIRHIHRLGFWELAKMFFLFFFGLSRFFLFDIVMYVNWHICFRLILWIQLINLYLIIILKEIEVCWYITTSLWCNFFVIS